MGEMDKQSNCHMTVTGDHGWIKMSIKYHVIIEFSLTKSTSKSFRSLGWGGVRVLRSLLKALWSLAAFRGMDGFTRFTISSMTLLE